MARSKKKTTVADLAEALDKAGVETIEAEEAIVTASGVPSDEQVEYLKELEGVVTPAYIAVVKKAFPWLSGLTVSRDDDTHEWFAVFDRDGNREACALAGTTFPQFPDDFVQCVKKHLGDRVDRSKMKAVAASLADWETPASTEPEVDEVDDDEVGEEW